MRKLTETSLRRAAEHHVERHPVTEKRLVDPISPSAVGGLLYRVLGFPMKTETRVPLADGRLALPVDGYQSTTDFESTDRSMPITTPRLMRRLFQSIV